jgi:hypothetical protein
MMGDRLGFKNRVGLDITDKYFLPAALDQFRRQVIDRNGQVQLQSRDDLDANG